MSSVWALSSSTTRGSHDLHDVSKYSTWKFHGVIGCVQKMCLQRGEWNSLTRSTSEEVLQLNKDLSTNRAGPRGEISGAIWT